LRRRHLLFLSLIFLLSTVLLFYSRTQQVYATTPETSTDWPMFHQNLNHTGCTSSTGPSINATLWVFSIGSIVHSSPAVSSGQVYIGSGDGNVYAFGYNYLIVRTSGVSSDNPVTVTRNSIAVGTASDSNPLMVVTSANSIIGVSDTVVWSNVNTRYKFMGWTGDATGTSTVNPVTVTLTGNSSCTANFKTQYLNSFSFKDYNGLAELYTTPTQVQALAPNRSLVKFTSYSNLWLDSGTWTIKQIRWQSNNIKPFVDPTYTLTSGGAWVINCQVYNVSFSTSFKDSAGTALYTLPSSFKLTFPNNTVSSSLDLGQNYLIQNGTTKWNSITWQGTELTPSTTFDATDGNPSVNCTVYSLTINPAFKDNTGSTLDVQPSSWTVQLPNGTSRTLSTLTTYNQTQGGNYSITSIIWQGKEVVPLVIPSTKLTASSVWNPSINCRLPTSVTIELSTISTYVGFKATITGNLTCNKAPLPRVTILLEYSVTGGKTWNTLTMATTRVDGGYLAEWVPSVTGDYIVRATWTGNSTYPMSSTTVNMAVTPTQERYVFSVSSNSTVSAFAFNSTGNELSFTVSGPSGTMGFVKVTIAKNLTYNIADLKVYLDNTKMEYTASSIDSSWLLYFTYSHTTHSVRISLGPQPSICFIATTTYGSELSPEVQFLREFRDNTVLATFTGSQFMEVFNGIYYSFSPTIASTISSSEAIRSMMKVILYPLMGILHLGVMSYSLFSFSPDLGIMVFCLVVISLMSIVYLVPWTLLFSFLKKKIIPARKIRIAGLIWSGSTVAILIAEILKSPLLMMASGGVFVLATSCLITLATVTVIMKRLNHKKF